MHARHKLERMPQATPVGTIDLYLELHTLLIRISIVFMGLAGSPIFRLYNSIGLDYQSISLPAIRISGIVFRAQAPLGFTTRIRFY
jgi:hypothetical protein